MKLDFSNPRICQADVDPRMPDRWSPRAFLPTALNSQQVESLLEAARWAPSAYNEQPWRLVWASQGEELEQLKSLLVDGNRVWADRAPFLVFFVARLKFSHDNSANSTAIFDCGAAWMAMALQARAMGLYGHGMSGLHHAKAMDAFGLDPAIWTVVAAAAFGYRGPAQDLPERLKGMEMPSGRKPLGGMSRVFKPGLGGDWE